MCTMSSLSYNSRNISWATLGHQLGNIQQHLELCTTLCNELCTALCTILSTALCTAIYMSIRNTLQINMQSTMYCTLHCTLHCTIHCIICSSLITADGAYHCPVGSIGPFLYLIFCIMQANYLPNAILKQISATEDSKIFSKHFLHILRLCWSSHLQFHCT